VARRPSRDLQRRLRDARRLVLEGRPPREAARAAGTSLPTLVRHGIVRARPPEAGGGYRIGARYIDTPIKAILEGEGEVLVSVQTYDEARLLIAHDVAVVKWLAEGDPSGLDQFRGRYVVVDGERRYLETDPATLKEMAEDPRSNMTIEYEELYEEA
jgi:hypothetical protein